MEQSANPEVKNPIEVSKLHFLIHPGFLADPDTDLTGAPVPEFSQLLLERYLQHAKGIPDDELVLVFLHTAPSDLIRDFRNRKNYTEKIRQIKRVLGKRMLTFSADFDVFGETETTGQADEIKQMAERRGFRFNENVPSEAYGETLGVCVEEGASNLNKVLKLVKKTLIRPDLTDAAASQEFSPEDIKKHKGTMRSRMGEVFDYIDF